MPQVQLIITMDETGQVSVGGPIDNRVLCYGLLGVARDVIHERAIDAGKRLIVTPSPGEANLLSGDFAGGKKGS